MIHMQVLKFLFLIVAIVYTFSNVAKVFRKLAISNFQLYAMATSIVFYYILEFELGY